MKIYDCFIFFNENLLTEIRFNILDKYVDYFVICESYYDHRGKIKGYLFDHKKFKNFSHKIIYLKIDNFPESLGIWERQDYQRNFLMNGLKNTQPDDLIIYSDADEIINPVKERLKVRLEETANKFIENQANNNSNSNLPWENTPVE